MAVLLGIFIGTLSLQSLIQSILADPAGPPPPPCICQAIYKPVCGDNGITYSNDCVLKCVSDNNVAKGLPPIKVASLGECKPQVCICPTVYAPVCGTDGKTYPNDCELACYNEKRKKLGLPIINISHPGICIPGLNCIDVIIPVCGSDGRTYRNICYLQLESLLNKLNGLPPIWFKSSGPCPHDTCPCPLNLDPLCASDGKTYSNKCQLNCENRRRQQLGQPQLKILHLGACNVPCPCPLIYAPVCGSDGKTYTNKCYLDCENKKRKLQGLPLLTVLNNGVCKSCSCPQYVDPVCGSDGVTYSNTCYLACKNKIRASQNLPPITITKQGYCAKVGCNCSPLKDPVCASDGRTYKNPCLLNCENLVRKSQGLPPLIILFKGICNNNCQCSNLNDPLCVTDKFWLYTFGNQCKLDCENWRRYILGLPPFTTLYQGVCVVPCQCNCNTIYKPVCGSDKKTYRNICWMVCTSQCNVWRGYPPVNLVKLGPC